MFFNEDHYKVTKVRTLDGTTPLIVDNVVQTKVVYFPKNPVVKKLLEEQNTRLPNGMKMKIELMNGYVQREAPAVVVDTSETDYLKKQLEELRKQNAELDQQNKELQDFKVLKELEEEQKLSVASSNIQQTEQ